MQSPTTLGIISVKQYQQKSVLMVSGKDPLSDSSAIPTGQSIIQRKITPWKVPATY
jgi:hypothetical protein